MHCFMLFNITWITNSITGNCSGYPEMDEAPFLPVFPSWDSSTWQDQTVAGKTQERFTNSPLLFCKKEDIPSHLTGIAANKMCVVPLAFLSKCWSLSVGNPTTFHPLCFILHLKWLAVLPRAGQTCKERWEKDLKILPSFTNHRWNSLFSSQKWRCFLWRAAGWSAGIGILTNLCLSRCQHQLHHTQEFLVWHFLQTGSALRSY